MLSSNTMSEKYYIFTNYSFSVLIYETFLSVTSL